MFLSISFKITQEIMTTWGKVALKNVKLLRFLSVF